MSSASPILHLICGMIASGKSTLCAKLGDIPGTVTIAEDDWLSALYSGEMSSISDYVRCSAKLQTIMGPHIISLLKAQVSVVLDFPANTVANRIWMREIIQASNVDHKLHYLDVPDEICKARLQKRNADGNHPFAATDEQFLQISKHFVAPRPEEGFDIVRHPFDRAQ